MYHIAFILSWFQEDIAQPAGESAASSDPPGRIISIVIVLFILSVITEKLTKLLRILTTALLVFILASMSFVHPTQAPSIVKPSQVLQNLGKGNAVKTDEQAKETLIIDPDFFKNELHLIFSFLLTAFFLAFGSKFFHDLLDNVLQVKNLKRKMLEKATYEATTIMGSRGHYIV